MNKGQLVDELAERTDFTKKDSKITLNTVMEIITEALTENDQVLFTGFGKFEPAPRKATEAINPQTGEKMSVPSKVVPKFRPGKNLRERVNRKLTAVETGAGELRAEKA